MKFPVFSQPTGKSSNPETGSLETGRSASLSPLSNYTRIVENSSNPDACLMLLLITSIAPISRSNGKTLFYHAS